MIARPCSSEAAAGPCRCAAARRRRATVGVAAAASAGSIGVARATPSQRRAGSVTSPAPQVGGELVVGGGAVGVELATQRLERRRRSRRRSATSSSHSSTCTSRSRGGLGDVAERAEAGSAHASTSAGEDLPAVAQDRAGAPHGDAEVVEELRVDVVDRALAVGLDGVVEVGEHEPEALDGRQLGIERDARVARRGRPDRRRRRPAPCPRRRSVELGDVGADDVARRSAAGFS